MATIEQPPVVAEPQRAAITNGRWIGYARLLQMRMLELWREPEVIFWVFVFPLLLALGLGIAFRSKPADITPVAIIDGPKAQEVLSLLQRSPDHASFQAEILSAPAALDGFRLGKYAIVVSMDDSGGLQFRYDPARPESVLARTQVDDAIEIAAGRKNPISTQSKASSEPGARYIDFLIPGLLGMNLMNSGMWGIGFALVEMRQRKLLKRFVATPMRRSDFLLALASSRLVLMIIEVGAAAGIRRDRVSCARRRQPSVDPADWRAGRGVVRRRRLADRQPRAENRERQRIDQRRDDADVDLLRRVLLLRTLSEDVPAGDSRAATDRAQRRAPSHHSSGRDFQLTTRQDRRSRDLGRRVVCAGVALVPLELSART